MILYPKIENEESYKDMEVMHKFLNNSQDISKQIDHCIEEFGELISSLIQYKRVVLKIGHPRRDMDEETQKKETFEEIIDSSICLNMIGDLFEIDCKKYFDKYKEKMNNNIERFIDNEYNKF